MLDDCGSLTPKVIAANLAPPNLLGAAKLVRKFCVVLRTKPGVAHGANLRSKGPHPDAFQMVWVY